MRWCAAWSNQMIFGAPYHLQSIETAPIIALFKLVQLANA
jgi:hypothetical protein